MAQAATVTDQGYRRLSLGGRRERHFVIGSPAPAAFTLCRQGLRLPVRLAARLVWSRWRVEGVRPVIAEDVAAFGDHIAVLLHSLLAEEIIGTYFVGSVALGGYVAGESDLDILAVCERRITDEKKSALANEVLPATALCPARGLEFTLYRLDVAAAPPVATDFEVNVNGGPRMSSSVHVAPEEEPSFWYVLDRAIAHRHGVVISGPPAKDVFADAPRSQLLNAMQESMRWHRKHERATLYSVLNASRAWRFAKEDVLGSKLTGASWARSRWRSPSLIDAALALRHGRAGYLDEDEVDGFLDYVEHELAASK